MKKVSLFVVLGFLLPSIALAAPRDYAGLIDLFVGIVKLLLPVIFLLSLLFFAYGLAKFIFSSGDPAAHESGRNVMIWGLVALFVLVSTYGLIRFFGNAIFGDAMFQTTETYGHIYAPIGSGPGTQ